MSCVGDDVLASPPRLAGWSLKTSNHNSNYIGCSSMEVRRRSVHFSVLHSLIATAASCW